MERESIDYQTDLYIKEIGTKIRFKDLELLFGMIKENIRDNGKIIKCMEKVNIFGLMEDIIKAIF